MFDISGGSIINISAALTRSQEAYQMIYAASKSAVNAITISLAQELGPKNIRVAVLPGPVLTEGVAKLGAAEGSEAAKKM